VTDIKRKKGESFDAFMRRVKRRWQQSGRILQAKKIQHFSSKKSKNMERKSAIERSSRAAKMDYLRKVGKLPLDEKMKR
jgi:ribosomal protein S21